MVNLPASEKAQPPRCQSTQGEQALIEGLKQKSDEAFEELVAHYARRLYYVSLRILRNPQDAEDAVQETLLNTFQSIDGFREECSLYSWLYRIVCNQSLEKLRQRQQRVVLPIEPYLPEFDYGQHKERILDWNETPDRVLHTEELSKFFEQCIDELPEDYRIAYILKDVEKLSEDQAAEIAGVNKSTIKNRVHRARLVIRKRVQDHFFKEIGRKKTPTARNLFST